MFEIALGVGILVIVIAFIAEYIDSTLGMGYGTSLTPALMLMGFEPLQIVPAVLLSELITGFLAGFVHHSFGNVNFKPGTLNMKRIVGALKKIGIKESFRLGVPLHLRLSLFIGVLSIIGTVAAVFLAINLPKKALQIYIGVLVLLIGIVILATINKRYRFSWKRVGALGIIASFNKGLSGGGYGPVVTGGQLIAGVHGKNAVAITSLAEALTCVVGVIAYFLTKSVLDWTLAPYLIIGAVLSVPLSGITVKKLATRKLKWGIGIVTIVLGVVTLAKIVL